MTEQQENQPGGQPPQEPVAAMNLNVSEALDQLKKIGWGQSFQFRCHKEVACWTDCCHHTQLFLTPYDVMRLKNKLALDSSAFLEKYTSNQVDPTLGLPVVKLAMADDEKGACPFVTKDGCTLYNDRPTACRVYPLGQAAHAGGEKVRGTSLYFILEEEQCKGWREPDEQSLEEWVVSQELADYTYFNELIMRFGFHPALKAKELSEAQLSMYYMALYDLDRFRRFVFDSTFLEKFALEPGEEEKIAKDDEALLRFALKWLEASLAGLPSLNLKNRPETE